MCSAAAFLATLKAPAWHKHVAGEGGSTAQAPLAHCDKAVCKMTAAAVVSCQGPSRFTITQPLACAEQESSRAAVQGVTKPDSSTGCCLNAMYGFCVATHVWHRSC